MDEELDEIFTAEIDEEFGELPRSEQPDVTQNQDAFFSNSIGVDVPEDDGKRENRCLNCLKAIWATRNRKILQDKEAIIRTTVRELIIYAGFIIIVLTIALLPTAHLQTYFFTDIMQLFNFPSDSSDEEAITAIHDRPSMWNFILSGLLASLYSENTGNRLVGCPRIRQVRVSSVDCHLPDSLPSHLQQCFPTFSKELENRDPIVPAINKSLVLSKPAWHWRSASESGSDRVPGTIATYTGSGYYLDLSLTHQTALEMLEELYTNLWTSESTRALIIDFTTYNANLNFFCVVQLLFETPYTGGVIGSVNVRPLYLIHGNSPSEWVTFVCEIISLVFVAYYIIKEIISIAKMGLSYFRHFWHLIDFLVIALSIVCVGLNVYNRYFVMTVLKQGISASGVFPEFVHIAYMTLQYKRLLALLVFFSLIQVSKPTSTAEQWTLNS